MNELSDFTKKWCLDEYPPERVDLRQLDQAEQLLGIELPMDYRFQVLSFGLPQPTLALLTAITDLEIDLPDLSELYQPEMIVTQTQDWRKIGMPASLVAIGGDSLGNLFCFDEQHLQSEKPAKAPIYYWDHDFDYRSRVAPSFSKWIAKYLASWSRGIKPSDF